jgi:DNA recombination protein RmuC
MEAVLMMLAGLVLGAGAGFAVLRARAATEYQRGLGEAGARIAALEAERQAARQREDELRAQLARGSEGFEKLRDTLGLREQEVAVLNATLRQERAQAAEKLAMLTEAREALSLQFKTLANDILEEKSQRFTTQNKENLDTLLAPLAERIQVFSKQVQDTYDKDSKERLTLEVELRRLQELNTRLNQDAEALTRALTGAHNKTQGNWGEMVLERVLESSGLQKGREYRVQVSDVLHDEEGTHRYQPDVIIDLPEGKQLVVDSKVSLNAYTRYIKAVDEAERELELKAHCQALRNHIRSLSEKRYQDLYRLNTLDFVFMFVPVEPAYLLAVQHDMALFNEAFEKRIMVVGPSTLLATLRTVSSIWRHEYQNRNAQEIARQSGAMYDKFAGFVDTLDRLGKQLDGAHDSWQDAMKKLRDGRGNLMSSAERLRRLGIKSNKRIAPHLLGDDEEEGDAATDAASD